MTAAIHSYAGGASVRNVSSNVTDAINHHASFDPPSDVQRSSPSGSPTRFAGSPRPPGPRRPPVLAGPRDRFSRRRSQGGCGAGPDCCPPYPDGPVHAPVVPTENHSGQVAFPGGRIDETDKGALAAALRESEEEVGLDRAVVEPIGYLDLYQSTSGYRITPVVAIVTPPLNLVLNRDEVEETFEVPLDFLMEVKNHKIERREWKGRERAYVAITFERHYIWGVTAGILRNLREKVLI
jgi:8-oxo-dGTP pyrophosphatase MutT (NUDIX family)